MNDLVSVVIPAYNRERTICAAVNSVLAQTYENLEVIVVDDGSSDNTADVLKTICDDRLRYVYQDNAGACAARNNGINNARGSYIAFHDSDDIWHSDKLQKQMDVFEAYNPDIVFCLLKQIFRSGAIKNSPDNLKEGFMDPVINLFGIGTQTIVAKRKVFEKYKFDPEMPRYQEFEFLYRAVEDFSLYCLNEPLVDYEVGDDSISSNPKRKFEACDLLLKKHPELKTKYPEMAKTIAFGLINSAIKLKKDKDPDYKKYLKMAKSYSSDPKVRLKAAAVSLGVV